MLGDTGVAVSPKDRRYAHLVGKTAVLPLMRREIPIVADPEVDPKFGTGAVKVTPAHDPNDYDIGRRHNLPLVNVQTMEQIVGTGLAPERLNIALYGGLAALALLLAALGIYGLIAAVEGVTAMD